MRLFIKIVLFIAVATLLVSVRVTNPISIKLNKALAIESDNVYNNVSLPNKVNQYKQIVKAEVRNNPFDWRLIMAIIKQESQYDENAVSYKGAQGLMQLMPITQTEFDDTLMDAFCPKTNIKMGISYFIKLYRLFESASKDDQTKLALAAYNAGPSRIYDAQDIAAYLGENPNSWRVIQNTLPLLSKRYHTLHQRVWETGKPRNGYFGGWQQTVLYVENFSRYHKELQSQ